jgi:DNA-binding MarR family transcriptional regulator
MTEPRWLTDEQQRAWRPFIDGFHALIDALDRQLQADSRLPHSYFEVLIPLSEVPGRSLRMSELADRTRSSRSRLSHAVARLEEQGWVRRVDCPTDKRGQVCELTDEGFAMLAAATPGHVEAVRQLLIDRLNPEQLRVMGELGEIMLRTTAEADLPPRRG